MLQQKSVDVDERDWEEMQSEHRDCLIFQAMGGPLATFAIEDAIVSPVPVFAHLKPVMHVSSAGFFLKGLAEKDRLDHLPEYKDRVIGRVWEGTASQTCENGFGIGRTQPECRGIRDHGRRVLPDQVPAHRWSQDGLERRRRLRRAGRRPIELLAMDPFEAG